MTTDADYFLISPLNERCLTMGSSGRRENLAALCGRSVCAAAQPQR